LRAREAAPAKSGRSVIANATLALAALIAVFAAAEAVIRAVYHPENLGTVIRFDPSTGWSLMPGATLHSVDNIRDLEYTIHVNSMGLRDREFSQEKPDGKRRVVFIGDSFAFGVGVDEGWRCSDFVARALDDDCEVINASVCGWGTDQELIHYERFVRKLEPDAVVLTFCMSNDVLNNMLDHLYIGTSPKPRFVLRDSLVEVNGQLPEPRLRLVDRARRFLRQSRLLVFVKRRIDATRRDPDPIPTRPNHPGYRRVDARDAHSHWSVFERRYDPDIEEAWRVTEAILERFAKICRRDGTELIVLAFPLELEVDDAWREDMLAHVGIGPARLDLEAPFDRLQAVCDRLGVSYLHPLAEFRRASGFRRLYFERDVHPNRYGHAVAAAAVLPALRARLGVDFHVAENDLPYTNPSGR
jgi:lysophospholipase L1-like esterase